MAIDHKAQSDNVKAAMPDHSISYYSGGVDRSNALPERRFKSKTEMNAEEMIKDAKAQGLNMEVDNS